MKETSVNTGLIAAYWLDGHGVGQMVDWETIPSCNLEDGRFLWMHLNYTNSYAHQWLKTESHLNKLFFDVLTAEETRPRAIIEEDAILVCLRGVNLNPGEDPEDMVSIRIFLQANRIISTRHRHLLSIDDIFESIEHQKAPVSPADFLIKVSHSLVKRIGIVVNQLGEKIDELEDAVISQESRLLRSQISDIRRQAILIRRYLFPQQEALQELYTYQRHPFLDENTSQQFKEVHNRTTHYLEDLSALRDRAAIIQEELSNRIAEKIDKRMYILSLVAVLFLPLTFVTGLLGINVGGIPGTNHPWAFTIVSVSLCVLGLCIWLLFRRKKWM